MRWKLRDDYFPGRAGIYSLTAEADNGQRKYFNLVVDPEGYFEFAEDDSLIGIFAERAHLLTDEVRPL